MGKRSSLLIVLCALPLNVYALDFFSYSGRLVNGNGAPVTGPVNLRFELRSTDSPSTTLCTHEVTNVPLAQGVFHVKLNFIPADCGNNSIQSIMEAVPAGHSLTYQVTDVSNSRIYSPQLINAVPASFMSNYAKNIAQNNANDGEVLKWDDAAKKWVPGTVGSGNGTVTSVSGVAPVAVANGGTTPSISITAGGIQNSHLAGGIDPAKLAGVRDGTNYLKGDNTWGNYAADVLNTILTGFAASASGTVLPTDTLLIGMEKLQGQVDSLSTGKLDKTGGTLVIGTIDGVPDPISDNQVANKNYVDDQITNSATQWTTAAPHIYYITGNVGIGTSTPVEKLQVAGNIAVSGKMRFKDAGANYVELQAPAATAGVTFILPGVLGTDGQVLKTDAAGNLSWTTMAIDSSSITDGSIVNADISPTAGIAQSKIQNLTTDLSNKEDSIAFGSAGQYWSPNKTWQALTTDVVAEGTNKYFSNTLARAAISGTTPINYNSGTGVISLTTVPTTLGGTGLTASGTSGNLLRSDGTNWTSWTPNFISSEVDTLATVTGRGATTATAVTFSGGVTFPGSGVWNASGNVGVGTSTPRSKLDVAGGVQLGTDAATCDATKGGTLRYNTTNVEYCNGASWQAFGVSGAGITNINGSSVGSQSFAVPGTSGTVPGWTTVAGTGVHTLNIPLAASVGVTAGLISKTDYDVFNAKLGTSTSLAGDVSGTYNATSVDKIKGTPVAITTLTTGNILKFDGTNWINTTMGAGDIPNIDASKITTGILPVARGGTNTGSLVGNRIMVSTPTAIVEASAMTNGQLLIGSTGSTPVAATLTAGTGVTISNTAGGITINASGSGGTVTNVSGTAPISVATGTSTPVISISQATTSTNGYLSSTDWNTFNNKQAPLSAGAVINGVTYPANGTLPMQVTLAPVNLTDVVNKQYVDSFGQWGTSAGNVYRTTGNVGIGTSTPGTALEVAGQVKITGGTPGTGKVLTSDATGLATWTTIAAGGGTVTNVTGTAPISVATGTSTPVVSMTQANTTTNGYLSSTDWNTFNNKLGTSTSLSGDVSGTYNATSVDKIKGTGITITTLTSGNFLKYNGTAWINAMLGAADIPSLDAAKITTGVLPVARGGTNTGTLVGNRIMVSTPTAIVEAPALTNGQLLIGSTGATPAAATLTAGTGVTITNSAGGITIAAAGSGGTVTNVTGTAPISVATGTSTPVVSMTQANTTTNGYLSSTDWNTFNNKQAPLSAGAVINGVTYPANGTLPMQVTLAPVNLTDVVNKQYVDSFGQWGTSAGNVYRTTGNVGIGTSTPGSALEVAGQVKITGGTPGTGKVLTSDAAGLATWSTPAGGTGDFMKDGSVAMTGVFKAIDGTSTIPSITFAADTGTGFFRVGNYAIGLRTTSHGNLWSMGNSIVSTESGGAGISKTAGTGAAPAFFFQGDANTGMFAPTLEVLGFSTNGTEKLRINSTGDIGIGTTTPGAKLEVAGQVKITGGTPGAGKVLTSDATGLATWQSFGSVTGSGTANTIPMFSTSTNLTDSPITVASGRVYIGGSPTFPAFFSVKAASPTMTIEDSDSAGVAAIGSVSFRDSAGTAYGSLGDISTGDSDIVLQASSGSLKLSNIAAQPMIFLTSGSERVRIDPSGNIGIGTTTPLAKLHVNGNLRVDTLNVATATHVCIDANNVLSACSSSIRYKENVLDLDPSLETILKLRPVIYDWILSREHDIGFIAEEVEKVDSRLVTYNKENKIQGVKYDQLTSPIVKAIQELYKLIMGHDEKLVMQDRQIASKADKELVEANNAEIGALKAENAQLKQENEAIKAYLCSQNPAAPICK